MVKTIGLFKDTGDKFAIKTEYLDVILCNRTFWVLETCLNNTRLQKRINGAITG